MTEPTAPLAHVASSRMLDETGVRVGFNDQAQGEAQGSSRLSPGATGSTPATNGERA